jgi:hypothetical protein
MHIYHVYDHAHDVRIHLLYRIMHTRSAPLVSAQRCAHRRFINDRAYERIKAKPLRIASAGPFRPGGALPQHAFLSYKVRTRVCIDCALMCIKGTLMCV